MKRLFFIFLIASVLISNSVLGQINPIKKAPLEPPRVADMMSSLLLSVKLSNISSYSTTSSAYYPVSAYLDDVALTVTFTESVGIANVMVYDANNQLVDMVTVDTSSEFEAVLATDTWVSGSYKLVVSYGATTLEGYFNF